MWPAGGRAQRDRGERSARSAARRRLIRPPARFYKCEAEGIKLAFVDPAYTSQTCSQCKSRLVMRVGGKFECRRCGYKDHADYNAAVNVRDKYLSPHLYVGQAVVKQPDFESQEGLVELPF